MLGRGLVCPLGPSSGLSFGVSRMAGEIICYLLLFEWFLWAPSWPPGLCDVEDFMDS